MVEYKLYKYYFYAIARDNKPYVLLAIANTCIEQFRRRLSVMLLFHSKLRIKSCYNVATI